MRKQIRRRRSAAFTIDLVRSEALGFPGYTGCPSRLVVLDAHDVSADRLGVAQSLLSRTPADLDALARERTVEHAIRAPEPRTASQREVRTRGTQSLQPARP